MITLTFISGVVIAQAVIAFFIFELYSKIHEKAWLSKIEVGDPIVYCKQKVSTHPGERAYEISPAENGDNYSYIVDKYWTVADVLEDNLVAITRTNKHHLLRKDDPNLRRARIIERLRYRNRFPQLN
jgi:predicted transcriptional regulator of viral defense system